MPNVCIEMHERVSERVLGMGTLYVLSSRGDTQVSWAGGQPAADDREARAAIAEAEAIFAHEISRGASAFKLAKGQLAERIDSFDPSAEEIVIVPRMAGGG